MTARVTNSRQEDRQASVDACPDDFTRWEQQLAATGYCTHPVRLAGRIDAVDLATGETRPVYTTAGEPGGVLLTACGNRRESVCLPCSQVYKRDARQLVKAGLAGGKGIPETVAAHPCVFATFTAPSFGPVHSRRKRGKTILPCRPRRDAAQRRCPHGRDISCPVRHHENDPRLGRPLCPDCYDYETAVLFNACAGELWRRFTINLPRKLAALAGITQNRLRSLARVRYVKVAEYQARGAVHFHAVIRLDAPGDDYRPPADQFTAELLADAIGQAAAAVRLPSSPMPSIRTCQPARCGSAPRPTPARCTARPSSPPVNRWTLMRWRTTSPSTSPRASTCRACLPAVSAAALTWTGFSGDYWPHFEPALAPLSDLEAALVRTSSGSPGPSSSPSMAVAPRTSRSYVLGFACGRSTWTCGFATARSAAIEESPPAPGSRGTTPGGATTHPN